MLLTYHSIFSCNHPKNSHSSPNYSEPSDLDTIYKVLKKAGEISAAADKNQASGSSQPTAFDIPTVNVPDYPDRPRRGPLKSLGPTPQQQKQGLTAPTTTDVSSSGPKMQQVSLTHTPHLLCLPLFSTRTNKETSLHENFVLYYTHYTIHHPSQLKPILTIL